MLLQEAESGVQLFLKKSSRLIDIKESIPYFKGNDEQYW
jgi:hypothetical protein